MAQKYAIVDIETTGGHFGSDRITEIAIVVLENGIKIREFQSLVNPNRSIPPEITRITGINNQMVAVAPQFFENRSRYYPMYARLHICCPQCSV